MLAASSPLSASQGPIVDPYGSDNTLADGNDDSFVKWLMTGGADGGMPVGITPGMIQKYTQYSEPSHRMNWMKAQSNDPTAWSLPEDNLFNSAVAPHNFWLGQYFNGLNSGPPQNNNLFAAYNAGQSYVSRQHSDPWEAYWAYWAFQQNQAAAAAQAAAVQAAAVQAAADLAAAAPLPSEQRRKRRSVNRKRRSIY